MDVGLSAEEEMLADLRLSRPVEPVPELGFEEIDREGRLLCEALRSEPGDPWRVAYATFPDGRRRPCAARLT